MPVKLNNTQRHNRIFVLVMCGFLLIGGIRFFAVDPSWFKAMLVLAPITVSAVCLGIIGTDFIRLGLLISVVVTTVIEMLLVSHRIGGWEHQRFWMALLLFVSFNAGLYIYTAVAMVMLARRLQWPSRKPDIIDWKGEIK